LSEIILNKIGNNTEKLKLK